MQPHYIAEKYFTTMHIWRSSMEKLRCIQDLTGERLVKILDRIIEKELERIKKTRGES